MTDHRQTIRFLRQRIPSFECLPGCHDCCGPVMASSTELAYLPERSEAEHEAALRELSCPHLGEHGCQAYAERPLICRLFGTTQRLACPHGRRPATMVAPEVEEAVFHYFRQSRQVLV
ncbi:YkgJ family cysteine cluster protein [Chitinimonas sp.]|uniref:YkgJ family cysteine cluster protein n=1 Tax=Chitinimonas sp. TaxID=1934313 RepID=UPI002F931632